jgi:hypothetical protein
VSLGERRDRRRAYTATHDRDLAEEVACMHDAEARLFAGDRGARFQLAMLDDE